MENTMYQKIFRIMLLLCALSFTAASAQEENIFTNDPIVITAARYETSVSREGKAISVITEEDINRSGKKNLADVLEAVAGVTITRSGSEGSIANVYIRGSKSGNVLIMIDGVRVSDPTSAGNLFNISGITSSNIERIEVVRGAMSSMYGAEASGGVINIITKKGAGKKLTLAGEAGSNKTFSESVSISDSTEKSSYFFSGSHYKTGGITSAMENNSSESFEDDSFENITASGKINSKITENASVDFTMNYTDSKSDIDDGSFQDDPDNTYTSKLFTSHGEFKHSPFSWWTYKAGVSYMSFVRDNIDPKDSVDTTENNASTFNGSNSKADFMSIFKIFDINTLVIGADILNEKGRSTSSYYDTFASADSMSIFEEKSILTKSVFIHDSISAFNMIYLNAGARIDDHEVFGTHNTWDASAAIVLPVTGTKLKCSAGTGFRAPSLSELYGIWGGNDQLKPEKTYVYDAGVYQEFFSGIFSIDCTYFVQNYKDMIEYNDNTWKYYNADGEISNKGVEVVSGIIIHDVLRINYGYTYSDYSETGDTTVLKRPKHKHSASLTLSPVTGLDITGSYLFVDERYDYLTATTNVKLDAYHKFDVNIRYSLNDMLTFTARGENLTNTDYMETYGYNTKERSFFGGVEVVL
jgi:vitamin B12 transporter